MTASSLLEELAVPEPSSRFSGFYRLDVRARHAELARRYGLTTEDLAALSDGGALGVARADRMVENCVGVFGLPLALGLNFRVNGRDVAVPMAVEEPSIVAAVSGSARLVRDAGGFRADADPSVMIAQIQVLDVPDPARARARVLAARAELCREADRLQPSMAARGGGARDVEVRILGADPPMVVVHILLDCLDAMGANTVNTVAEALAPRIEALTGGRVNLRILSNLADRRLARASCAIPEDALAMDGLPGERVAADIIEAWRFAAVDPYRAATHNKGVMNGIDAVAIATGNDWRGIEAGAHAYAARDGRYTSLTRWWRSAGCLHGSIELPMAVGTVGGSTTVHPLVRVMRKVLRCHSARELASVMAAVGLAQNLGAIRALATDGIQRGHMALHARTVALARCAEVGVDG
ncbi:MAG: hydroxymethylglutaryl-CoA reductase, degradative [Deltaproteobacteria bacterium]|nr:hydroxymethylglutaryl-CoA reductase, degradative [Deltaproteobacteria bacterium]